MFTNNFCPKMPLLLVVHRFIGSAFDGLPNCDFDGLPDCDFDGLPDCDFDGLPNCDVNVGPCTTPRPDHLDFQRRKKWDAWKSLRDMSQKQAMREYINELEALKPDWQDNYQVTNEFQTDSANHSTFGLMVSTMYQPEDALSDDCKTVFDWCKEGNVEKVVDLLTNQAIDIDGKDREGLSLLHWACDRGLTDMVKILLERKADPDMLDVDSQTAMHYASSCDHLSVVKLLIEYGACCTIIDVDGFAPNHVTDNKDILHLLSSVSDKTPAS